MSELNKGAFGRNLLLAGAAGLVVLGGATPAFSATVLTAKPLPNAKNPRAPISDQSSLGEPSTGISAPFFAAATRGTSLVSGFEGTSDYDSRALGAALIPPDTMGAVGTTQYAQLINGTYAIYNKTTGALAAPRISADAFWLAAGGTATGGDPRILFDGQTNRWLAIGFGAVNTTTSGGVGYTNIPKIQVAVSTTDNALGPWRSASFTGYNGAGFGGAIADFPTLAISGDSITIGTNDFAPGSAGGAQSFKGTTLSVLSKAGVFASTGPDLSSLKQFVTGLNGPDNGYAIQGVNSTTSGSTAHVIASSRDYYANVFYQINDAGTAGATQTASQLQIGANNAFTDPLAVRQPVTGPNARVMTAGDSRTATNAWEVKGRTYFATTVRVNGTDHNVVRVTVMDSATGVVLSETDIGGGASNAFDYSYGSLAVNASGQVVVSYNRSGDVTTGQDGRISIFARSFNTNRDGTLKATSGDILVKQSLVDEYHNGSAQGQPAVGRQRFGDYSAVNVDPTNSQRFWVVGEFAREYNNAAGGHPGGSGFGRWGTYIGQLAVGNVPEPANWMMMIVGFGAIGCMVRRRTVVTRVTYA